MRIANNIMALNAHRQLTINQGGAAKSIEKLSSGFRINRAGDDAAGLAISEKMRGQIRGLNQAIRNAQDGISLIQTAEGALNEVHAILQRMRELAVQSANDTNTDSDRSEIQKEIEQLKAEIDRIAKTTEFNTKSLLNGDVGQSVNLTQNAVGISEARVVDGTLDGTYKATFANTTSSLRNFKSASGISSGSVTVAAVTHASAGLSAGRYTIEFSGDQNDASAVLRDANGKVLASVTGVDTTGGGDFGFILDGTNVSITVTGTDYNGTAGTVEFELVISTDVTIEGSDGSVVTYTGLETNANSTISAGGFEFDVKTNVIGNVDTGDKDAEIEVSNNGLYFHIGANEGQRTRLAINRMDTVSLKIHDIDVTTQSGANSAITRVDTAIQRVSNERSKLGAMQNRLEHTISNLGTAAENLQAAESRIRDVDMAKEMMNFTKYQILQQASTAMLAQANLAPQSVLQLLG